uniref:Putative secreted protein n=1 Tax=Ixodes ricinus TaxID=34613 RepID=A0A6B0UVA8_IXORI
MRSHLLGFLLGCLGELELDRVLPDVYAWNLYLCNHCITRKVKDFCSRVPYSLRLACCVSYSSALRVVKTSQVVLGACWRRLLRPFSRVASLKVFALGWTSRRLLCEPGSAPTSSAGAVRLQALASSASAGSTPSDRVAYRVSAAPEDFVWW